MSDGGVYFGLVVGFGFIVIVGRWLGDGSRPLLAGLFAAHGVRDWPTGVQEGDAPRFAVAHLDELRPGQPPRVNDSGAELLDRGSRPLGPPHA